MQCTKTIEVRDDTKDGKQWVLSGGLRCWDLDVLREAVQRVILCDCEFLVMTGERQWVMIADIAPHPQTQWH